MKTKDLVQQVSEQTNNLSQNAQGAGGVGIQY